MTDVLAKYVSRPTNPQNTPFFDMQYAELVPMAIPLNLSMNQCISHPCFDVLFSHFSINDIVQIYSSILLEKKIAFVSQDPHKSSLCVIACASLMRPFKVTSTIIPVFIDSNTNNFTGSNDNLLNKSFIIGTTNSNIGADLIADVSTGVLSMKIPQQLVIPRSSEIIRKINLVIQNRINDITVPPAEVRSFLGRPGSNPKYDEFFKNVEPFVFPPYYTYYFPQKYIFPTALIDSIREIFASHIAFELNDKIKVCIVKNKNTNIDELNKQMFLKQFNLEESLFIIQFIETGVFTDFYERSQQQMNKKPIPLFRASSYTTYTKYNMVSNATDALSPFANDANDNSIHE
ncbi:hypothetical protein TRFO_40382 [Tritrichomonas foetus]|uniref:UDENN domain-containing protein n=1 Tax=Tritrichomonas foetus TaxID=1144522 RepID=A0A1J4J1C4_9EUKA|nr:hypothetical protein TRFO_40382 [Tritrichomonas foetus]|eukprot:OHS93344.1 hypothetical protein TRFO_40382 [Tritrichomonas foetus]